MSLFKNRREYLRKYGKFLVAEYEECRVGDYMLPYTPMRFVSQDEINQMVDMTPLHIRKCPWFDRDVIPIRRQNTFNEQCEDAIYGPGYYRVEVNEKPAWYFKTACAYGIPIHSNPGRMSHWEERFNEEWRRRSENSRWDKADRERRENKMRKRRNRLLRISEKLEAKQFFQALAMSSAVAVGVIDGSSLEQT